MEQADLRDYATEAIKIWEPWRLLYNLVLAAIVITYFAIGYPASKTFLTVDFCLGLFLFGSHCQHRILRRLHRRHIRAGFRLP